MVRNDLDGLTEDCSADGESQFGMRLNNMTITGRGPAELVGRAVRAIRHAFPEMDGKAPRFGLDEDAQTVAIAAAMQRVADAQRALADLAISGARTIAERQQQLVELLLGRPPAARAADADTLVLDVDWDTRAVTLTQTTGNVLRVAVNGALAEVPDRARISLNFNDVPRGDGR